jgi:hypothetical protein
MKILKSKLKTKEEKQEEIYRFVIKERERMNVKENSLGVYSRSEGSCFSYGQASGEFKNLLYAQLIYIRRGYGDWNQLSGEVLEGLLKYIRNIKNYRQKQ